MQTDACPHVLYTLSPTHNILPWPIQGRKQEQKRKEKQKREGKAGRQMWFRAPRTLEHTSCFLSGGNQCCPMLLDFRAAIRWSAVRELLVLYQLYRGACLEMGRAAVLALRMRRSKYYIKPNDGKARQEIGRVLAVLRPLIPFNRSPGKEIVMITEAH